MEMRPTARSQEVATKVFGTLELLEAVLLHLPTAQVLQAMQINKASRDIVLDSPKMLDVLQLRPLKGGYFSSNIESHFAGLPVETHARPRLVMDPDFRQNPVVINIQGDLPKIGWRCRSMLIVQPPVTLMKVTVSCCTNKCRPPRERYGGWR